MIYKPQIIILLIGMTSLVLGVWTLLQTPTLILAPWVLVVLFLPVLFVIALLIGFIIKRFSKGKWHTLTFASIVLFVFCLSFFISEYLPSYKIEIPKNYEGRVILLLSNRDDNKLSINSYGIGYLNESTYKNGFRPKFIKDGKDITKQITGYGIGSFVSTETDRYKITYLNFNTPEAEKRGNLGMIHIDELIKLNAIDTTLLKRK